MKKRRNWDWVKSRILELVADSFLTESEWFGVDRENDMDKKLFDSEYERYIKLPFQSGWYFHGKLQDDLGYDLGFIRNLDLYNWKKISGKYLCKVYGISKPCIGYFWHSQQGSGITRLSGLVCYEDDYESLEYLKEVYREKSPSL